MLSLRLIRLMDTHSDLLGSALLETITSSPECADMRKVPPDLLRVRTYEIYRDLNQWLTGKTSGEMARYYRNLGAERSEQAVPLSHLIWAIRAAKKNLWDFLEREGLWENPVELHGSLELLALLDRFFDEAIYHAAVGYERHQSARAKATTTTYPWEDPLAHSRP